MKTTAFLWNFTAEGLPLAVFRFVATGVICFSFFFVGAPVWQGRFDDTLIPSLLFRFSDLLFIEVKLLQTVL